MPPSLDALLPHRPPFRFVDEVVTVGDGTAELLLRLPVGDPRLTAGSLAPLLLVEALAQAAAVLHALTGTGESETGVLVELGRVRLVGDARAGDEVHLQVRRTHQLGAFVRLAGQAAAGGRLLAEGELTVARGAR